MILANYNPQNCTKLSRKFFVKPGNLILQKFEKWHNVIFERMCLNDLTVKQIWRKSTVWLSRRNDVNKFLITTWIIALRGNLMFCTILSVKEQIPCYEKLEKVHYFDLSIDGIQKLITKDIIKALIWHTLLQSTLCKTLLYWS